MARIIKEDSKQHNHFVDALKGVCIIFVIVLHLPWSDEKRLQYLFPFWMNMAVPIFMIISGYVYALSYKRNRIEQIKEAYLLKNVVGKMIRYTFPFLVAFTIEMFCLVFSDRFSFPLDGALNPGQLFLQGGLEPGSYYYPLMMQFIFVFPIIYFVVEKYQAQGVLIWGCVNALFELLQWAYCMNAETYRLLLFRYLLLIAAGCYIASDNFKIYRKISIVITIIGAGFIYGYCYLQYKPKVIIYWTQTCFVACFYIIPLSMFMIRTLHNIRFKPLEILGKASYHIFLTQMVWYYFAYGRIAFLNIYIAMAINLIICTGVGVIFYFIETPLNKLINRKILCLIQRFSQCC